MLVLGISDCFCLVNVGTGCMMNKSCAADAATVCTLGAAMGLLVILAASCLHLWA